MADSAPTVNVQSAVLLVVFAYDVMFAWNGLDYHVLQENKAGHKELYRPMLGLDDLRVVAPHPQSILMVHIFFSFAPLFLSLWQNSRVIRKSSLVFHRLTGRICLLCALIGSGPALFLATKIQDNGHIENAIVVSLAIYWIVSMCLTFKYAFERDIVRHRAWAVRFTVITHAVPLISRVLIVPLWAMRGFHKWTLHPPTSSDPSLFPLMTWCTAAVLLPTIELFVFMEMRSANAPYAWSILPSGDALKDPFLKNEVSNAEGNGQQN